MKRRTKGLVCRNELISLDESAETYTYVKPETICDVIIGLNQAT